MASTGHKSMVTSTGHGSSGGQYRPQEQGWPVQVTGVVVTSTGHRSSGGQYRSQERGGHYFPNWWPVQTTGAVMTSAGYKGCGDQYRAQELWQQHREHCRPENV